MQLRRLPLRCLLLASICAAPAQGLAQTVQTFGATLNSPVFEQVDQNGVDLVSGHLRVTSPLLVTGSEEARRVDGLQWVGSGWTRIEHPTIWLDNEKYIVNYRGQSDEFNDEDHNFSQRAPITGATLTCAVADAIDLTSECIYTDRNGDIVQFKGIADSFYSMPNGYGQSTFAWGNLGMSQAIVYSHDNHERIYGHAQAGPYNYGENGYYYTDFTIHLDGQKLTINTPNHASNMDEHYLRPDNVTQTITDTFGQKWYYLIDNERRMRKITPPGGAGAIDIVYWDSFRVRTVTTPAGTWSYDYSDSGNYGTTTVTDPYGKKTYVTYHKDHDYVTEHRDHLGNRTIYTYDTGQRLTRITYPEGNYVDYQHDARGNVTRRMTAPKPSVGGPTFFEYANFPTTCTDPVICNRPLWVKDAKGNQTDFAYQPSTARALGPISYWFPTLTIHEGTGKPITVTSPAVGGVRPQVRNTYNYGRLIRSSTCRTLASCAGTSDEVVTEFDYGTTARGTRLLFGSAVTSAGVTLRTCYGYDDKGRRISETPPIAGLGSCPASVTAAPAVTATMPSAGTAPVAPTFPDGSTSEPTLPPPDQCGPDYGTSCP